MQSSSYTANEQAPMGGSTEAASGTGGTIPASILFADRNHNSGSSTAASSPEEEKEEPKDEESDDPAFAPIIGSKSKTIKDDERPSLTKQTTADRMSTPDLAHALSRRRTAQSEKSNPQHAEERAEIERLMSRMFGEGRQNNSEEEKTRHVGVVFKNLTVKGVGLGAALQPTIGDIFMGLPRKIRTLFSSNKKSSGGPPVRTLINDFTGAIRPGEMLLVLGRPGSGCSTFLKVLGNQRAGFKSIDGEVTYGGASADIMGNEYRGEVLYNPEDDLHYATLSVKRTLEFALRTRTPGKESRMEGETRKEYVQEFLKTVTQLCEYSSCRQMTILIDRSLDFPYS